MPADLNRILDTMHSAVLAVDAADRVVFVNRSFTAIFGVDAVRYIGAPVSELVAIIEPNLLHAGDLAPVLSWRTAEEIPGSRPVDFRLHSGACHFREDSSLIRGAAGALEGVLFVYHDMNAERAIDRMKSEFIAVASHELRTPMTSIKGSVDLILSGFAGAVEPDTKELLEIAQKNCDRLIRLINDILDLAKIEAGQIKMKIVQINLAEAAAHAIQGVKSLADQRGVTMSVEAPGGLPNITGDRDRIEQVLTNLLSNAIKFSPRGGRVTVEITAGDDWVECGVRDQGCGIAEIDLPKVFGKFQQVGDSQNGGTGLGLAIAQALTMEHKGRMWVESKVGEGSRFAFRLPASNVGMRATTS